MEFYTEETKLKMSQSRRGKGNVQLLGGNPSRFSGKTHTEETKQKMRGVRGKQNYTRTKDHSEKIAKKLRGRTPANKGLKWWTDGTTNKYSKECPGTNWRNGVTRKH